MIILNDIDDMNLILIKITQLIEHYGINISDMAKKTGISRGTLYNFLYKDSKDLNRIKKILLYLKSKGAC